jgi:phosphate transport system substrate-binding protein
MKRARKSIELSLVFLAVVAMALIGCGQAEKAADSGAPAASERPLTIKGSDTMVILGQRLSEEYMKNHAGKVVQVNGGGSGTGIAALINGTVDLAQASRPMKDKEKEDVQKNRGAGVVETPVALDSLAVFVNAGNTVSELTVAQVKAIYKGEVTNWKDVGGSDATIVMYGRENSSGTYDYFREHVLDKEDFSPRVQTLQGTAAVVNAVGKDPNAIGYGGIAYEASSKPLALKKDDASPAVAPSEATVADGTYVLSRYLYYYYTDNAPERVTEYVKWSLTPEAQSFIAEVGYFPLATTGGGEPGATEEAAAPATE